MIFYFYERLDRMFLDDKIIVAISTPPGKGGIGIVRLSGKNCVALVDTIFEGYAGKKLTDFCSHKIVYGKIIQPKTKEVIDEVLVSVMRAPKTYTKEDVTEINCHGGYWVTRKIVELCMHQGARLAQPGEFTRRAFLNGRIDLSQAEAVADMIHAETEDANEAAAARLSGKLGVKISNLREQVLTILASVEASIDYPEHELEEETYPKLTKKLKELQLELQALQKTYHRGKILREGVQMAILGRPNVGKSSLLNALSKTDKAIVTDIPGTTRDIVEETVDLDGIAVHIMDTAGIRQTTDEVEKIGVNRALELAKLADVILIVLDASAPLGKEEEELLSQWKKKKCILVCNKADQPIQINAEQLLPWAEKENIIYISAKEDFGIDQLTERIKCLFWNEEFSMKPDVVVGSLRQKEALYQAELSLHQAEETLEQKQPLDLLNPDLMDACMSLGEITGHGIQEEVLDHIFSQFCLGK